LSKGEQVWQAHRTHYYQRATDRGFSVTEIVGRVFALNLVLCGLACISVAAPTPIVQIAALVAGAALVSLLLMSFTRGKR
jgi:hypothetical protein